MRRSPSAKSLIFSTNTSGMSLLSSLRLRRLWRHACQARHRGRVRLCAWHDLAERESHNDVVRLLIEFLAHCRAHFVREFAQWFRFGDGGKNDGDRGQLSILPVEADIRLDAGCGLERALDCARLLGAFDQCAGHVTSCKTDRKHP